MCAKKPLLVRNQSSKHTAINRKKKTGELSVAVYVASANNTKRFKLSKNLVPVGPVFEFREKYNKKE